MHSGQGTHRACLRIQILGTERVVAHSEVKLFSWLPVIRQGASIGTTKPAGKLVFGIFAALAEFERELISERTKVGLIFVRAHSRKGGDRYKMTAAKLRLAMASMGKTADHGRQPMP